MKDDTIEFYSKTISNLIGRPFTYRPGERGGGDTLVSLLKTPLNGVYICHSNNEVRSIKKLCEITLKRNDIKVFSFEQYFRDTFGKRDNVFLDHHCYELIMNRMFNQKLIDNYYDYVQRIGS